jgi:hypothetical protein
MDNAEWKAGLGGPRQNLISFRINRINGYFSDLTTLPSVGDGKGLHVGVPVL